MDGLRLSRRAVLSMILAGSIGWAFQTSSQSQPAEDWVCPMHPDYHSPVPGVCPRCGMKLISNVPEAVEYELKLSHSPKAPLAGAITNLTLDIVDPRSGKVVRDFNVVHEKIMHVFLISQNLQFFTHVHPVLAPDGSFHIPVRLPFGGMYRLLADYYPSRSLPQLTVQTIFVRGSAPPAKLEPVLRPSKATNVTASLRIDPFPVIAGMETKLFFTLEPSSGLEPYLGAWAHMLVASEDLIDLIHVHPFLVDGGSKQQFNIIFPRPGLYRIWTQFQRLGVVNTVEFTVPVQVL